MVLALGTSQAGWACDASGTQTIQFDIKPQPLASALNAFALQSHQQILFTPEKLPPWSQLADHCAKQKIPLQMRMIDGELAFPDETPPHDWRELRVGTPGGMITLKRDPDGITLVIWGNADENLCRDWNALAAALRELTG